MDHLPACLWASWAMESSESSILYDTHLEMGVVTLGVANKSGRGRAFEGASTENLIKSARFLLGGSGDETTENPSIFIGVRLLITLMLNDIAQFLQPRMTMATKKSCNLIGAAIYRWQAQIRALQVTRPSLPGVGLAPRD